MAKLIQILIVFGLVVMMGGSASGEVSAEVEKNVMKLKSTYNCSGCDLSGADLRKADLREADLTKANLTKANLTKAKLKGANLKNTKGMHF